MLRIHEICYEIQCGVPLFAHACFEINQGDRIGLVGPNGAGKSTLMRIVAGELAPSAGNVIRRGGLRVAYLEQEAPRGTGQTLFDRVMEADAELARLRQDPDWLGEYVALGGPGFEARVERALSRLGFPEESWGLATEQLSSGQRMRAELARCILSGADLLLLDEPTNHLDSAARSWLEGELRRLEAAVLLVSHDRAFLNRVTNRTVLTERGTVQCFEGNYEKFIEQRSLKERQAWQQYEARERQAAAERAAAEKRMALARKMVKAPEGQRDARGCAPHYAKKAAKVARTARIIRERQSMLEAVEKPWEEQGIPELDFSAVERGDEIAVRVEGMSKRFGERVLFQEMDLHITRGERWVLSGPNGSGKSTLLRMMAGTEQPDSGVVRVGGRVRAGYLAQEGENLTLGQTPLELCLGVCGDETRVRTMLACLKLRAEQILRPLATLSAGERTKAGMAMLLLSGANLLLLDEPTNHLEMEARAALEEALERYPGTVVLSTHDEWLAERIADHLLELGATIEA